MSQGTSTYAKPAADTLPNLKGFWSVTVKSCGTMDALNELNIKSENAEGVLTGVVEVGAETVTIQSASVNADKTVTIQFDYNGSYTLTGTYVAADPPTRPYAEISGTITGCPSGGEPGTWSAQAQTGGPPEDPPTA